MNSSLQENTLENQEWPVRFEDSARLIVAKEHKRGNKVKIKKYLHDNWLGNLLHPVEFIDNQIHKWFI